jgi:hypothetical protein
MVLEKCSHKKILLSIFYPDDGGSRLFGSHVTYLPNYMASQPGRL